MTCTDNEQSSVELTVVDATSGDPIDATVTFQRNEGETREPQESSPGSYQLASEEDGTFAVTIEADGYATQAQTYEVELEADGCHVRTVRDTIELTAE